RGHAADRRVLAALWQVAERELPHDSLEAYTQGLMDLGASLCSRTRPGCDRCPLAGDCIAHRDGLVESMPAARPRRSLPLRERAWLVIRRDDEVLVEKRAPSGVWGALWCLPEAAPEEAADAAGVALRRFALRARARGELAEVHHAFTHFRLCARPLLLECESAEAMADAMGAARWLALDRVHEAPLPAPVKTLLRTLVRVPGAAADTGVSATVA